MVRLRFCLYLLPLVAFQCGACEPTSLSEDLCLRHIMTTRSRYAEKTEATCEGGHNP